MSTPFLQAEWRKLAMANYSVDPSILKPYLPAGTELDLWQGTCYASLVGFMFLNVKLKGFKIPFHVNFEEVNLRFYVRHKTADGWKRGVVFISEIVPRPALTLVANLVYGEHYENMPMTHAWTSERDQLTVEYKWKKGVWNSFKVITNAVASPMAAGSEEEFITEHYWGYTKLGPNKTSEYGVEHPRWDVYQTQGYEIHADFGRLYGPDFAFLQYETPKSVFLAEGSEIRVLGGRKL